jgi:hypothetical protein
MEKKLKTIITATAGIAILVCLFGLAFYAYLGIYNRYWADDYCYNADYQRLGIVGTLKGYTFITTYASNRYSLTFFNWLFSLPKILGVQMIPGLMILSWLGGLFFLFSELNRVLGTPLSRLGLLLFSVLLVYFSLYLAPNQFQILYWRTGILTYSAPLIGALWLLGLVLSPAVFPISSKTAAIAAAPLAFITAGFSEAGAAYGTILLVFSLFVLLCARRRNPTLFQKLVWPGLTALLFMLLAMGVLILSPANRLRQTAYGPPATVVQTLLLSLRFGLDFVWFSLRGQPLPNLVFLCAASACAVLCGHHRPVWSGKQYLAAVLVCFGFVFLLTAAIQAPSTYIALAPPDDRSLILCRFVLLFGLAGIGWILAGIATRWFSSRWVVRMAVIVLLLMQIYMVRSIWITSKALPRFVRLAQVWDQRDHTIRAAKQKGQPVVAVQPIDSQWIGGVFEMAISPNWINICAAHDYGVPEIRATIPWEP